MSGAQDHPADARRLEGYGTCTRAIQTRPEPAYVGAVRFEGAQRLGEITAERELDTREERGPARRVRVAFEDGALGGQRRAKRAGAVGILRIEPARHERRHGARERERDALSVR